MPTAYSKDRPNKYSRSSSKSDRYSRSDDRNDRGSRKRDRDQYKEEHVGNEEKQELESRKDRKQEEESQQPKKRKVDDEEVAGEQEEQEQEEQIPDHLRLSNFRISSSTVENLEARGIRSLFEIQAATFDAIFDGNDVLARARTGTGKTLAFALPVIEKLALDTEFNTRRGRAPRVLVMCPTRDLAKQVCGDFESVSGNRLKALAMYGGVPYKEQTSVLRDGVDVIVGTPGRVLDHIKFGNLKLHNIRFIILDEADEMLDARGFEEDMFNVLNHIKEQKSESRDYQTLLFSATVPDSVMTTIKRFMKEDYKRIDLVGNSSNRTNQNIRHIAMPTSYLARADIIGDVVNVYGRSGLTVIFCATKADANELGTHAKLDAAVLHGDIAQQSREATMKAFREGKYKCIVCTDVMARGLDIPQVDLVINCQPPLDTESYVHRSGRTGRAGRKGICVTFYKPQEESILKVITRKTGVKFEMMAAPRPEDIIKAATEDAFKQIETVKQEVLPFFAESADKLIEKHGARDAVAAVLALVSGYQNGIPTRSLLSGMENQITLFFQISHEIQHPGYVKNIISREYPEMTDCKGWRMTRDMKGVVFDAPANQVEVQEDGSVWLCGRPFKKQHNVTLSALQELPELAERNDRQGGNGYGRFGGNGGGGYGRNGYSRNGGGYQSGGRNGYGRNNGNGDRQRNGYRGRGNGRY